MGPVCIMVVLLQLRPYRRSAEEARHVLLHHVGVYRRLLEEDGRAFGDHDPVLDLLGMLGLLPFTSIPILFPAEMVGKLL